MMITSLTILAVTAASSLAAARPDETGSTELFRFDAGDDVETFDTARFRVHFTRTPGANDVPLADDDASGVPDHVEEIGAIYEEVLDFYAQALGYRVPLADDDGIFDVYLVDFALNADGAFRTETCSGQTCSGFMVQENDFAGYPYPSATYANRLLASHEFFHAVQAAYDREQGTVIGEGTAVWASEQFDPDLDDLEGYSQFFLEETDRPLDSEGAGPGDGFVYGSAFYFQHLSDTHGVDIVRELWQACADDPGDTDWIELVDDVIAGAGGPGFVEDYVQYAANTVDDVDPDVVEVPFSDDSFLVFTASFKTLRMATGDRSPLIVAMAGEGDDVDGMRIITTEENGGFGTLGEPVIAPAGALEAEVDGAEIALVQIVNTRIAGNASRAALCIGDRAEVDACLAAAAAGEGEGDAPPEVPPPPTTCACAQPSPSSLSSLSSSNVALLAPGGALLALVFARRRRRR